MNGHSVAGLALVVLAGCGGSDGPAIDGSAASDGSRTDAADTDDGGSPRDGGTTASDGDLGDSALADGGGCPPATRPSYTCTMSDPGTCAGGVCIASLCLGPTADPDRWASCADGACDACESATDCPADCGSPPTRTGTIAFDPSTTITVKVHGLAVSTGGSLDDRTYGSVVPPGALEATIRRFVPTIPDGTVDETDPTQLVAGEYYGTTAAPWLSAADVAEIEALDPHSEDALERYARILAKFIAHRLALSGATHAAIVCHSMGCHVVRFMIEHDLEMLATTSRISRIVTVSGALAGARFARLFDNPLVRDYATIAPIQTSDFVPLNPDFVADRSAIWDHRLYEANNPTWSGILLHSVVGSDPVAAGGTGLLRPLDPIAPDDEANDSILFERDMCFTAQADAVRLVTPSGERIAPSCSWRHENHPSIERDLGAGALAVAGLYHGRRVVVRLASVTLLDDHERDSPIDIGTYGEPPADIVPEVTVRYDPYLPDAFGITGAIIHERRRGHRTAPYFTMNEGDTLTPGTVLFEGPVFDAMTTFELDFDLREVDSYRRYGVTELPSGDGSVLVSHRGSVDITDGTIELESKDARATLEVRVIDLY